MEDCTYQELEVLVDELEQIIENYEKDLNCFWSGQYPKQATLAQVILAQAGKRRIDEKQ